MPGFRKILFVAENQKMIDNLPYEFATMEKIMTKLGIIRTTG